MSDFKPLYRVIEDLPESSITTRVLGALDFVVPGEWQNVTNFEAMIRGVTGEEDQGILQQVGDRANALFANEVNYQRALSVFSLVDSADKALGAAAFANRIGERFSFLSFMDKITPKPDTAQAIDAGVKFTAELATFCLVNGLPGDSVGDFVGALSAYAKEDLMRIAAWVVIDGVVPLGPDFFQKVQEGVHRISSSELAGNGIFQKLRGFLPGGSDNDHHALVKGTLDASSGFVQDFVTRRGISREGVVGRLSQFVEVADDRLDYLAAALDMTTGYFEHTGAQSVARRIISRAYGEI